MTEKAQIKVERLSLKLSGLNEEEGRRLATLIGQELAALPLSLVAPLYLENLNLNVTAPPGGSLEQLSKQIVEEIMRQF